MRIACLQFAPQVGDVDNNLNRADAVLSRANPKDLDLLVLPEMAFSGYNFKSLQHISPFLEPTTAGITSLWARTMALKYNCAVTAGYPEKVDVSKKWPAGPEYYNSAVTVSSDGETLAHYRKSFLYYTDETWALEGPTGFYTGKWDNVGNVAMGICMDLNPYKFETPWSTWEFAHHCLHVDARLVILSMAWLTREDASTFTQCPREPDMETLSYWLARLEPLIRAETEGEIIVVFANRCGIEGEAVYTGTSAVIGINEGEVKVYGLLGRGEKALLIVDTNDEPQAKLVSAGPTIVSSEAADHGQPDSPKRHSESIDSILAGSQRDGEETPESYYTSASPTIANHVSANKTETGFEKIPYTRGIGADINEKSPDLDDFFPDFTPTSSSNDTRGPAFSSIEHAKPTLRKSHVSQAHTVPDTLDSDPEYLTRIVPALAESELEGQNSAEKSDHSRCRSAFPHFHDQQDGPLSAPLKLDKPQDTLTKHPHSPHNGHSSPRPLSTIW